MGERWRKINSKKISGWKKIGRKSLLSKGYLLHMLGVLYIILDLIIIHFNLGKTYLSKVSIDAIASIVPSIITTASLTLMPDSSAVILSISWVLVVLVTFLMIMFVNWENIDYENFYKKSSNWLIFWIFVAIPILIIFMASYTPHDAGIIGKIIYINLKSSVYFIILYGAGIWLSLSAGLFFIVFNLYYFFRKRNKK